MLRWTIEHHLSYESVCLQFFLKNSVLQLKDRILDLGNWFYKFMFHQFI